MVQVVKVIVNEYGRTALIGDTIQIETVTPVHNGHIGKISLIDDSNVIHFEDGACQPISTLVNFYLLEE